MRKPTSALPWLALLFAVAMWGISFISTKLILREFPPASTAFLRMFPALLVLIPLMWHGKQHFVPQRQDWLRFVIATFLGIVLYMVLENSGLKYTSASSAAMLVASIPIFVLVIESLISRQGLLPTEVLCILVSLGGVYLVLFNGWIPDFVHNSFLGNMLVLAAMATWIIYTFIARKLGQTYSGLQQTTMQSILAVFLYLPFVGAEIPTWHLPSLTASLNLIFLGVFCSGLAYVAYLYAIQQLGTVVPSAFLNLVPVVTILCGLVALGEVPACFQVGGAVLIVGSLSILSIGKAKTRPLVATTIEETENNPKY